MCGILAVFGASEEGPGLRSLFVRRLSLLRHRGPDSSGVVVVGNNAVGHERLAVVDPESGHQPFVSSSSGSVLSVNGEIYNHAEMRMLTTDSSSSCTFEYTSASDCEVLLHLYEAAWAVSGRDDNVERVLGHFIVQLERLRGMFAFVLFDPLRRVYLAARDHIGIIPLYRARSRSSSAVWFSSEMKAFPPECVDVSTFPPGHVLCARFDQTWMLPWYAPAWKQLPVTCPTEKVGASTLRFLLTQAVQRCLMTDVPWGVLLSGGLDSSLVAALACRSTIYPLHTFTIGIAGSPDVLAAADVASHLGTIHHEFTFTVQDGLDALVDVISHLETYDVTSIRASVPMFLLSRRIKSLGIKMILSGEGADEIFGGYLYFHRAPSPQEFHAETVDKLNNLHLYDCNRANKATSAWGVETRVPFLDVDFVNYSMGFDPSEKMIDMQKGRLEKYVLRDAFRDFLPGSILWRQKEQFSDGVGYGWIDGLKVFATESVSDDAFAQAATLFPYNTPLTKESFLYRKLFETCFPVGASFEKTVPFGFSIACSTARAQSWFDPSETKDDPSGRSVTVHTENGVTVHTKNA